MPLFTPQTRRTPRRRLAVPAHDVLVQCSYAGFTEKSWERESLVRLFTAWCAAPGADPGETPFNRVSDIPPCYQTSAAPGIRSGSWPREGARPPRGTPSPWTAGVCPPRFRRATCTQTRLRYRRTAVGPSPRHAVSMVIACRCGVDLCADSTVLDIV